MTKKQTKKQTRAPKKSRKKIAPKTPSLPPATPLPGDILTGTLRLHPRGFGFVVPEDLSLCPQDIFIPRHLTDNAVDGDLVEVLLHPKPQSEKGPEGKIIAVLKRGRTHLAGTISHAQGAARSLQMMAYVPLLGSTRPVVVKTAPEHPAKIGDRVILRILEWGEEDSPTVCEVTHFIGHINDPSCDISAAIEEFDLRHAFPAAAITQAKKLGSRISTKDLKGRVDLTKEVCVTIDPDTAKDFDDALSIDKDRSGSFHLGVHIADVAHYVPKGSPLDDEAALRANSTYFPGFCLPMLPHELSDELCSLKQGVVRLTVSVLMTFDKTGALTQSEVIRSYIKSNKRMTYGEAKQILDGKKRSPFKQKLQIMSELCALLKKQRYERGSIDFSLPELILEIDEKGMPHGIKIEEYDITHQLVEEFMLKANELVAITLTQRGKLLLYRVHDEPSEENMESFFAMARTLGFPLPAHPEPSDLRHLFDLAKDSPFSQQLAIAFIRNMKLATYSPQNVGHFGLALEHYCHFTSPIRRYSDLITQRLLFDEEGDIDLQKIALKCSEQERLSFRAESSVKLLKKLRLLKQYLHENPQRLYNALVTRIKPFGLTFEVQELFLEGFLHISELENDYFIYEPKAPALIGKASKKRHTIGSQIQVRVLAVDLIHLECKWEIAEARRSHGRH
jgi:ribonuclease R